MLKKVLLAVTGTIIGIILLLLIAVGCVLYVSPVRQAVLKKALPIVEEQAGYDIDLGDLSLVMRDSLPSNHSPFTFHLSPFKLYRAYKGEADLPVVVEIDSLFVGHRGADTLIYMHKLRLQAIALTNSRDVMHNVSTEDESSNILSTPIRVEQLYLEQTTFHSDSLIAAVGVDVTVGLLDVNSPEIVISKGQYPLHGLCLNDAYVGIDLRDTPPDTTAQDTTPMLMAFDAPDAEMHNIHFRLTPLDIDIRTNNLSANVIADVGSNLYDARRIDIGGLNFELGNLSIPADTIYGNARVELASNLITSKGLHVRSNKLGARADLHTTEMDLQTMQIQATGDAEYQGSRASLHALYDIDDEAYDAHVEIERVNLAPFLKDSTPVVLAGEIDTQGKGIDPNSRAMKSKVNLHLTDARYDNINVSGLRLNATLADQAVDGTLYLPVEMRSESLKVKGKTEHQFRVAEFLKPAQMKVDYHAQMRQLKAHVAGEDFQAQQIDLHFTTDSATSLNLTTEGLTVKAQSPMPVMRLVDNIQPLLNAVNDTAILNAITSLQDLTMLDTLRAKIPVIESNIALQHGSPAQGVIEKMGLDIDNIILSLVSDSIRTDLALDASIPEISHPEDSTALRLPAVKTAMRVKMTEGRTNASLTADSRLTDGAMSIYDLCSDAAFRLNLRREDNTLQGDGRLTLDSISYQDAELGNRTIDLAIAPSEEYAQSLRIDVNTEQIPLDIIDGFVQLTDIALHGAVKAHAAVDGLPRQTDISAEVLPLGVRAEYKPYEVGLSLGQTPIIMKHNYVDLNSLSVYGADSTFIALNGGLDLNSMRMDVTLAADSFAPVKLTKGSKIPVYGELATDIRGSVTGPLDSIVADVSVTILPSTDITYPINKKNLAQVKPYGTVNVRFATADSIPLNLGGQINVDDGFVRYSPKAYPIMPFHVDSGSHIAFHGPIGRTELAVSASQKLKADVQSEGEETRRVDFTTGVRLNGELDSIGLNSIGFFLEAPKDETITHELASLDEETREGLAATLLATGMYIGESNVAAQKNGYALSSIINSRINAAMANSKLGKVVDIDFSNAQTEHAGGTTNDMNIAISKSFFKDKMRVTVGSSISDNPEVNKTGGLLNNLSAEYKLTKDGNVLLRLFSDRDYNNVLEGELYKSGLGVRTKKEWQHRETYHGDSITRTYDLIADAGVSYRSNNSIGPDLTLKSSIKNLMGKGETFTAKGNGAYYWALRNRFPGDPKKTDTYKFGINTSLLFPYLHWSGDDNPAGETRYMFGYQYENIAGGYGVHKLTGGFTYFFHSENNSYITHAFTPFSLSVVMMKAESDSLLDKAAEYPQLIKVIAGNEFVPSVGYNFIYNDYRAKRAVNTMLDLGVKESGNLINALYCAFGHKWDEQDKKLGSITFNQFVKLTAELRNKFNLTEQVSIATRLFAGANIPLGNSMFAPLSEAFYAGGPNSMRSASPYAYGPGNFYSEKYNQNFFHAGDVKLEANLELRFPIVWKLYGATFIDAGNVWNWYSGDNLFKEVGITDYVEQLQLRGDLYDGIINNPDFAKQIALGTGAGLRLDIDGLVVRFDIGVAIHSPYQTFKYTKEGKIDTTQPIKTYFNIPSALDAIRFNFGIGYPF